MSTHFNNGSHYENHQSAAELYERASHVHLVAQHNGQQDHQTGQEQSRQALEHSQQVHLQTKPAPPKATNEHGVAMFTHEDIAALAHELWRARGCPEGSPDEDWFHAAEQLRRHK